MFKYFENRRNRKEKARELYAQAEAQGRLPEFYDSLGVPDSVDGRFEMIALHCYILMHRLQAKGDKKLSQALFDVFFKQMDLSLREMGVGDLGVPKHMKRMMQGFNGRATHYETAVKTNNREELKKALIQDVYGTVENPNNNNAEQLADYVLSNLNLENGFTTVEKTEQKVA